MTTAAKLRTLLKVTQKTQTELAELVGVSFPTINSWLSGKSEPRKRAKEKIDLLYQEYTGVRSINKSELAEKKKRIGEFATNFPRPLQTIISRKDLYDSFVLELTYHTNSIEGSTLNEPQVKAVIFDNAVIPDKTAVEHQEARNHQAALGYLFNAVNQGKKNITETDIKKLHAILMNGIYPNAGQYRRHPVRIAGSNVATANYLKVERIMAGLVKEFNKKSADALSHLAKTHAQFEQIHPFSDGNGRLGRLLMHYLAAQYGLPPILIKRERKQAYYTYLQRAQANSEYIFLESFVGDSLLESYQLLLK